MFVGFEDILGGLGDIFGFGDLFGGGRRRGPQRGSDLRYDLEISFDEAARGTETTIQIPRQELCEPCHGSGAAPGSKPSTCPQCRGTGQLRYQQGFFTVARTCGQCRGIGTIVDKPPGIEQFKIPNPARKRNNCWNYSRGSRKPARPRPRSTSRT